MSSLPRFAQFPKVRSVITKVAVAALNSAAPSGLTQIFQTGADGGIAVAASVTPLGTMSAASVMLYGSVDQGVTKFPLRTALAPAYTNSTTSLRPNTPFKDVSVDKPIQLEANMIVYIGCEIVVADGLSCSVEYQEFSPFMGA
jgi:hypothetical protein